MISTNRVMTAFLLIALQSVAFANSSNQQPESLSAQKIKDGYAIRRTEFLNDQLKKKFKVPPIGVHYRPDFKAPVDGTTERKKVSKGITFSRSFARLTTTRALLLFSEGNDLVEANDLLMKVCDYYLNCDLKHLTNKDSFYWASDSFFHVYHKFGPNGTVRPNAINADTQDAFLRMLWRYATNSKRLTPIELLEVGKKNYGYSYQRSENHWCMEVVTIWGFSEILATHKEYKNRKLDNDKTPSQMAAYLTDYLKVFIRGRAANGFFTEISSGGYNSRMLAMFSSIHDYAKDKRLRIMARDIQDLYWAFWAEESIAGERGGGKVRERSWMGLRPRSEAISSLAKMYFDIGEGGRKDPATMLNTLYSSYYPSDFVLEILSNKNKSTPYEVVHRRIGKNIDNPPSTEGQMKYYDMQGHVLKYSWCEDNYILGTCMRPPLDASAWPLGSTQSWHHGLLIRGDKTVERVIPKVLLKDTFNEQYSVQSKGTLLCRRLPSERNGKAPMGVFVSSGLVSDLSMEGNDVFINNPNAYVAIRSASNGFNLQENAKNTELDKYGIFLKNIDMFSPVIIEVANPEMFASFDDFKTAVLKSEAKIKRGRLEYKSIYGDTLTMITKDNRTPLINGKRVEYHPRTVYQSPFIQSKFKSGKIYITTGDEKVRMNFNL